MEKPRKTETKMKLTYMIIPYAETPYSPMYFISCRLNTMFTMFMAMFVMKSAEPLLAERISSLGMKFVFPSLRGDVFVKMKNSSGPIPPTHCPAQVAAAAPSTPSPTDRKSVV